MHRWRYGLFGFAIGLQTALATAAEHKWKTVTLGADGNISIAIPAAVTDYKGGKDPDDLMFFSVQAGVNGSMMCLANRMSYPHDFQREKFAAALASPRREVFCNVQSPTVRDFEIGGSRAFNHQGMQAGDCTASYNDSADKEPGKVRSQMIIAAPAAAYYLTCTVEAEDAEFAQYDWSAFWGDVVRHMQASFKVPD